jgi:sugar transferase EpsL
MKISKLIKRGFDLTLAFLACIILSPVMIIIAVLIRLTMGPGIVFRQLRPGLHGKPFTTYKFRTMTYDRDSEGHLLPDAERLTRLGLLLRKSSLDELPQLINVLKGEMSLVGPRPLVIRYLPRYNTRQRLRHIVKPGITGWAQVNGRNTADWDTRLEMDVWYIEHFSLWLDCKILFLTFVKIFCWYSVKPIAEGELDEFWGTVEITERSTRVFPPEENETSSS